MLFPAGFRVSVTKKVYTPEISLLYRYMIKKKGAEASWIIPGAGTGTLTLGLFLGKEAL